MGEIPSHLQPTMWAKSRWAEIPLPWWTTAWDSLDFPPHVQWAWWGWGEEVGFSHPCPCLLLPRRPQAVPPSLHVWWKVCVCWGYPHHPRLLLSERSWGGLREWLLSRGIEFHHWCCWPQRAFPAGQQEWHRLLCLFSFSWHPALCKRSHAYDLMSLSWKKSYAAIGTMSWSTIRFWESVWKGVRCLVTPAWKLHFTYTVCSLCLPNLLSP